jgi:hypothetical protein
MKMKNEIHHIDEYFSEGLSNIELEPPVDVWKNIEKELDRKRRVRLLTTWVSMAAGLALLISLGIYILNDRKTESKQVAVSSKQDIQNLNTASNKNNNNALVLQQSAAGNLSDKAKPVAGNKNSGTNNINFKENISAKQHLITSQKEAEVQYPVIISSIVENEDYNQFNSESDYFAETLQTETSIEYIPLVPATNNSFKNSNLVSAVEVVNPLTGYGKANEGEKTKTNYWSVEGQVAPQYSYRNISDIKGYEPSKDVYNESEDALIAYGGGFKVNYQSGKRLSFQAGVYYSVMGQTMNDVYEIKQTAAMQTYEANQSKTIWVNNSSFGPISTKEPQASGADNNTLSTTTYYSSVYINRPDETFLKTISTRQSTLLENAQIIEQLKYIEVPFTARYKLINKKLGCHVTGGLSTNFLVNSDVFLKQNGSKELIGETDNLKRVNYSSLVGLGIDYQWFKNISLSLEPIYKYYINSISANKNVKVHPYSFGIFTGLTYKF